MSKNLICKRISYVIGFGHKGEDMQKKLELVQVSKVISGGHITGWALKFNDGQYVGEEKWLLAFFFPGSFLTGVTHVSMSKAHLWLSPKAALHWALSKRFRVYANMAYYLNGKHFLRGLPYGYFSAIFTGTDESKIASMLTYQMRKDNAPCGKTLYVGFEHFRAVTPFRKIIL